MLTSGLHTRRQMFGGMPGYINNLRKPAVQSQPLPPMASKAPPELLKNVDSLFTEMGAAPAPRMANAAPAGLMGPTAAAHQSGPSRGLLGMETFKKPDMTWSDKLGLISGMLMDYDGTMGSGNADKARGLYDQRVAEAQGTFEEQRQRKLMEAAAGGDMNAMFMLDPALALGEKRDARDFRYGVGRDKIADTRYDTEWQYGVGRDQVGDQQWQAEFDAQQKARAAEAAAASAGNGKYGVTPIYGRDANGNRVLLQTSNAGGVMQVDVPEGVTLEDDYSKSYDRTLGSEAAKKDMYKTTAGMGVLAVEEGFNRVSQQIDQAIQLSDGNNTGLIGSKLPAPNLDAMLETIGANTAFESLVALKSQGGTLGALSDAELGLLMSKVANLKRSQTQDQLDANLEILRIAMQNSMMRIKQAYEQEYANGAYGRPAAPQQPSGAKVGPSGQAPPPGFE